jgi:hypothetical protein
VGIEPGLGIAHNAPGFHKEICRIGGGFAPRINQTAEGQDASSVRFSVKFCQH